MRAAEISTAVFPFKRRAGRVKFKKAANTGGYWAWGEGKKKKKKKKKNTKKKKGKKTCGGNY